MTSFRTSCAWLGLIASVFLDGAVIAPGTRTLADESGYSWVSVPIAIEQLPARAASVPMSVQVDFSAWLERLHISGVADERSLRLYRANPNRDGGFEEETVQFVPKPQPRAARRELLPKTGPSVSYLAEYRAAQTPAGLRVTGELTWLARSDADGRVQYRLDFGVPKQGSKPDATAPLPHTPASFQCHRWRGCQTVYRVRQPPDRAVWRTGRQMNQRRRDSPIGLHATRLATGQICGFTASPTVDLLPSGFPDLSPRIRGWR